MSGALPLPHGYAELALLGELSLGLERGKHSPSSQGSDCVLARARGGRPGVGPFSSAVLLLADIIQLTQRVTSCLLEIIAKLENDHHLRQRPGSWWVFRTQQGRPCMVHYNRASSLEPQVRGWLRLANNEGKCLVGALSKKQQGEPACLKQVPGRRLNVRASEEGGRLRHAGTMVLLGAQEPGRNDWVGCMYCPRQQQLRRQTSLSITPASHLKRSRERAAAFPPPAVLFHFQTTSSESPVDSISDAGWFSMPRKFIISASVSASHIAYGSPFPARFRTTRYRAREQVLNETLTLFITMSTAAESPPRYPGPINERTGPSGCQRP